MRVRIGAEPDDNKMAELILYVSSRSEDDRFFGATKLNKILFHAEFRAYRECGRSITGHPYFRLDEGPAPQLLVKIRDRLLADGDAEEQTRTLAGYTQKRLIALRPPDLEAFSAEELAIVDDVIDELWKMTGSQTSRASHRLPGWRAAADKEVIPYETSFLSGSVTADDVSWALHTAMANGWT